MRQGRITEGVGPGWGFVFYSVGETRPKIKRDLHRALRTYGMVDDVT